MKMNKKTKNFKIKKSGLDSLSVRTDIQPKSVVVVLCLGLMCFLSGNSLLKEMLRLGSLTFPYKPPSPTGFKECLFAAHLQMHQNLLQLLWWNTYPTHTHQTTPTHMHTPHLFCPQYIAPNLNPAHQGGGPRKILG